MYQQIEQALGGKGRVVSLFTSFTSPVVLEDADADMLEEVLGNEANNTKGRIEPYLQQLARYDARDIRQIRSAQDLSENRAVNLLKKGMLKELEPAQIKSKIEPFLDPLATQDHGRPLFADAVKRCGLKIRMRSNQEELWRLVWALYIRLNFVTSNISAKIIESVDESYVERVSESASLDEEEKI